MYDILAKVLIERKILNTHTELEIEYMGLDLSGSNTVKSKDFFNIVKVTTQDDRLLLDVVSVRDGHRRVVKSEQIVNVDGMDPLRFASVYGIKANGGNAAQQKRRGRKPKPKPERVSGKNNKFTGFSLSNTQTAIT